jgi:hypothetical protein
MTLDKFIAGLVKLQQAGHGDKPVFYRHGASGDCGELSTAYVTDEQGEQGPFDVEGEYVSVYAGS